MPKTIIFFITIITSQFIASQSINQLSKEGAELICSCTEKALENNNVNANLLKMVFESFQTKGYLVDNHKNNVLKIKLQLDNNYDAIERAIMRCRSQFTTQFSAYLRNKDFLNRIQSIMNNNAFVKGPALIQDLSRTN